jgi:hypothetical protein
MISFQQRLMAEAMQRARDPTIVAELLELAEPFLRSSENHERVGDGDLAPGSEREGKALLV